MIKYQGDGASFDKNWRTREETTYLHWTRGEPQNQIQLAFRRHWLTFQDLIGKRSGKRRCLEVGCGRGSLSAYFADAGWECTLLDLSPAAIERAKEAFSKADLPARFAVEDCTNMPFKDCSFDLVFSIGLLEHFEDIHDVIAEQVRVLSPDGLFIGYIVPQMSESCQQEHNWVNDLLRALLPEETADAAAGKADVFRSDMLSPTYLATMADAGLEEMGHDGIYPLPMISHSPSFPFSLLPPAAELTLVKTFNEWLDERENATGKDPWRCEEGWGQAFIVWGRKPLRKEH